MKLILTTQTYEWYGNDDEGYRPGAEGRWKPKGGSYIECAVLTYEQCMDAQFLKGVVAEATKRVNHKNAFHEEFVLDWELYTDDQLTPDEKDQMEFEGTIRWQRQKNYLKTEVVS